jgi:tripartite-type tricarboxylate transporter receptor subunit TctC
MTQDPKTFRIGRRAALLGAAGAALARPALAQGSFPTRPITLIVPFSAGGGTDLGARLLAADVEKELGTTIVVENREGAGSQVGITALARARPDGYTIGAVNQPAMDTIILSPQRQAAFSIDSFEYLINHVIEPIIIAVQTDSPHNTLRQLVDFARARSGELRAGTSGLLTPEHLAQLQFEQAAASRLRIAHFNGAADSMAQFRGGRTDIAFTTPSFMQDLKPLAIMTDARWPALPNLATAAEQGYPGLIMTSSRGFAVPRGVPAPVLARLRTAFEKVATSPEHQARAAERRLSVQVIAGAAYDTFVRRNHEEARKLVELSRNRP